jgi:hypothetical protein
MRESSKLEKLLPINVIRLNGYHYHARRDKMHSDKTKTAPHQEMPKIKKLFLSLPCPRLAGFFLPAIPRSLTDPSLPPFYVTG